MANGVDARDKKAKQIVLDWVARAKRQPLTDQDKKDFAKELGLLDALIPISAMGFRGVVLTAIVGRQLDPKFDPLSNFYDCNPRAIFEHGIYYALQESGIPCGKSDPLNVAKNIQKLDYDWAHGRRPESAARAAVDFLRALGKAIDDKDRYAKLVLLYFRKLHEYAEFVNAQNAPLAEHKGDAPVITALKLAAFVVECPEGGTIPQFVVGSLISMLRVNDPTYLGVSGVDESVFGTNTTSKKPADIWEIMADKQIGALYEVTVKGIDHKRLDDCVENLRKLELVHNVVTFICRLPEDVSSLNVTGNALKYKGANFQFLAIDSFIVDIYCTLSAPQQAVFMKGLEQFVHAVSRPIKTKTYWKEVFAS